MPDIYFKTKFAIFEACACLSFGNTQLLKDDDHPASVWLLVYLFVLGSQLAKQPILGNITPRRDLKTVFNLTSGTYNPNKELKIEFLLGFQIP